ncbi:hypothetical protein AAL_02102 [Moelleriella libera RCEF 2490]|uniref:NACHT domain-containing protein n=1 Tax=Moelleriella libera RCEF 2490 TaxID=1081109 RepID=A0A166PWM9_9HYPO|nr:hypothetical protein AAL_02102 [Moelleriella libera RCEF 2490]
MNSRFHDIEPAEKGTCDWLSKHPTYTGWAACDRGLLLITGKPGSGKSTLLRYVHDGMVNVGGGALILSFFFHGRGTELQRTPFGLFRALFCQLLHKVPGEMTDLLNGFQKRYNKFGQPGVDTWQWHPNEVQRFFESSLLKLVKSHPVSLFIDALDECGSEIAVNIVEGFKYFLEKCSFTKSKQFRICFTCRHYPILDVNSIHEVCMEEENRTDLSTFVRNELSSFCGEELSIIPDLIIERTNGSFLWAKLIVKQVKDYDPNNRGLEEIKQVIRSAPPELHNLYSKLIQNMDSESLKLIQWICFATRPLSLQEVRWAILIDADRPNQSLHECEAAKNYSEGEDGTKRLIHRLSCGLVEVVSDEDVVQFIHQSVKDFFFETGLSALDASPIIRTLTALESVMKPIHLSIGGLLHKTYLSTLDERPGLFMSILLVGLATIYFYLDCFTGGGQCFSPGHASPLPIIRALVYAFLVRRMSLRNAKVDFLARIAHYRLSRICIRYLAMEENSRVPIFIGGGSDFLSYATTSWVAHTKQSDARCVPQEDLLDCFEWPSNALVERWTRSHKELEFIMRGQMKLIFTLKIADIERHYCLPPEKGTRPLHGYCSIERLILRHAINGTEHR